MAHRLGMDVGGTFTDLLLVDDEGGGQTRVKVPSTPADPSQAVLAGVTRILREGGIEASQITRLMHGTTVVTNAVLEGKGARVGLITTQGFREILHLARSQTPGPLAGWIIMIKPDPPASLRDTREAMERMGPRGEVVRPVDREQVAGIVHELLDSGVESLTISLINAFASDTHEREIRDIVHEISPGFPVTISSEVLPEFREYERTLTACMNSFVRPRVEAYVQGLDDGLRAIGARADLSILRSDAGLMSTQIACQTPIRAILSGPAGGVAGALHVATRAGFDDILTFDMGGTSTDVALCQHGQPSIARETEIGFFRVKVPSVNVHSVGAGGGSIAHVPEITGALRVGPQSAGADPGPAAYGRGGSDPTVTDANLIVGHLTAQLLGGEMQLDREAATAAVQPVADAMGLDVHRAAEGILDIVNENMAGALRLVSVQRGYDPREFALVAFGGAGPLHANAVAKLMGSYPVLIPPAPGLLNAAGDLVADFREEFARTFIRTLDQTGAEDLDALLGELEAEALAWMDREQIAPGDRRLSFNVDMRYYRQGYEIPIEVDRAQLRATGTDALAERFDELHEQFYGFRMADSKREVVNVRAVGYGAVPVPALDAEALGDPDPSGARVDEHDVFFRGEWLTTAIYDRALLTPGMRLSGPAIITEFDSTTVVLDDHVAEIDPYRNILIRPEA
jgi:N-methylhydantoinase A